MRHDLVDSGGVPIHVAQGGAGERCALFVHGFPQDMHEWERVLPRLAPGRRVALMDMRGFGDSGRPLAGYDAETLAGDLLRVVEFLEAPGPVDLVAHDLGAPVAYVAAAREPGRVRSLTYLEAPLFGIEVEGLAEATRPYWHLQFFGVPDMPELLIGGNERRFVEHFVKHAAYAMEAFDDAYFDRIAAGLARPGSLRAALAYYRTFEETSRQIRERAARERLSVPVLALGGSACLGDIPLRTFQGVADRVEGGAVERCGHWIPEERPAELARLVAAFWDKLEG
jgi:pimeloyl-ACP methyl ester carboxylesterase